MRSVALSLAAAVSALAAVVSFAIAEPAEKPTTAPATSPAKAPDLPDAPKIAPGQRWVFTFANFGTDPRTEAVTKLVRDAKAAGYNGILVADSKFDKLHLQDKDYARRLKAFRKVCSDEGVKLILSVCPMGYATEFLSHDPNLAEGMPVRGATFIAKDGKLVPFDDTTKLVNGSFEEWKDNVPVGWTVDEPGKITFKDGDVKADGGASVRQQDVAAGDKHGRGRIYQKIKVKPWHYYHVTAKVKTENNTGKDWRIFAHGGSADGGVSLSWQPTPIRPTMDWTTVHATFCSQDFEEVSLYLGTWGGKEGKVWWDDVKIEPGGFVNVIRRDSLPLKVTSNDPTKVGGRGRTFEEGKDFSQVKDAKLFHDPNPGYFTLWHDQPEVTIPKDSRIEDGQKVFISYHFATSAGKHGQCNMCMVEPKVYDLIEEQVKWLRDNAQPDMWMMAHDEIRHLGFDDSCTKTGKTPGQILADNILKCSQIIKKLDPNKPILAWNDMFDPHHNAWKKGEYFYLVKGKDPYVGAWEGVTADITIANWRQGNADSAKFWSDRGNQQILAGYYDADPKRIIDWLEKVKDLKGIQGVMYTTWVGDYKNIGAFMDAVKEFEKSQPQERD